MGGSWIESIKATVLTPAIYLIYSTAHNKYSRPFNVFQNILNRLSKDVFRYKLHILQRSYLLYLKNWLTDHSLQSTKDKIFYNQQIIRSEGFLKDMLRSWSFSAVSDRSFQFWKKPKCSFEVYYGARKDGDSSTSAFMSLQSNVEWTNANGTINRG